MNPLNLRTRAGQSLAGLCAAAAFLSAQSVSAETLTRFEFNEGTGTTVTDEAGVLTGSFGRAFSPTNYPSVSADTPSGAAGDQSLTIVDPDGYLLMETTGAEQFYDLTQPLTVEGWINIPITAAARNEAFVVFGGSWKLGMRDVGRLAFTMFGVVDATVDVYPIPGGWVHLAAAWEPGVGVTYFMNGTEVGFFAETRPMRAPSYNYLGIGSAGRGEPINATIDRVRVHQTLLTAEELDWIATEPKAPLASTLVAFDFDSGEPPYTSEGLIQRETVFAQDFYIAESSPVFITESPSGQEGDTALTLDGNDRIVVDDPAGVIRLDTGDFTVQAWVRPGAQAGSKGVVFQNNGPGGALALAITQTRNVMLTTLGIADTASQAVVPDDGLWHHVAVIHRNGQDLRFFVDGVLQDTVAYTDGVLIDVRTATFFTLGSENGGGLAYTGGLDRFELLNEAVDPATLDSLAVPGVIPDAPELQIGTAVSIAWPTDATGFILQSSTDLNEPRTWSNVEGTPVVVGDLFYILLPAPEQKTFYQLVRPQAE